MSDWMGYCCKNIQWEMVSSERQIWQSDSWFSAKDILVSSLFLYIYSYINYPFKGTERIVKYTIIKFIKYEIGSRYILFINNNETRNIEGVIIKSQRLGDKV